MILIPSLLCNCLFQPKAFWFESMSASRALSEWIGDHQLRISQPLQFPVRDAPGLIDRWEFVRLVSGDAAKVLGEDKKVGNWTETLGCCMRVVFIAGVETDTVLHAMHSQQQLHNDYNYLISSNPNHPTLSTGSHFLTEIAQPERHRRFCWQPAYGGQFPGAAGGALRCCGHGQSGTDGSVDRHPRADAEDSVGHWTAEGKTQTAQTWLDIWTVGAVAADGKHRRLYGWDETHTSWCAGTAQAWCKLLGTCQWQEVTQATNCDSLCRTFLVFVSFWCMTWWFKIGWNWQE